MVEYRYVGVKASKDGLDMLVKNFLDILGDIKRIKFFNFVKPWMTSLRRILNFEKER